MQHLLVNIVIYYSIFVLFYFLVINTSYLALLVAAAGELYHYRRRREIRLCTEKDCVSVPSIAVIVPSHNEELTLAESVKSILRLEYPALEVLVINDGSTDGTLEVLKREFKLVPHTRAVEEKLKTETVKSIYQSTADPRLFVLDKERGGKADALNAGINYSRSKLFCSIDADTIMERDALKRLALNYMEQDELVIALGGVVKVASS